MLNLTLDRENKINKVAATVAFLEKNPDISSKYAQAQLQK